MNDYDLKQHAEEFLANEYLGGVFALVPVKDWDTLIAAFALVKAEGERKGMLKMMGVLNAPKT